MYDIWDRTGLWMDISLVVICQSVDEDYTGPAFRVLYTSGELSLDVAIHNIQGRTGRMADGGGRVRVDD